MIVFFDVDGVLIDGWHANSALRKPWDATLESDLGINPEAFQHLFFATPVGQSKSRMAECIEGRRDLADALAEVLPQLGYRGATEEFIRYWFEKDSNVNAAVLSLAEKIRRRCHARLYIATGQEHHRANYIWNNLGFSNYFDRIFYSAELGYLKKDPRFFEAINRATGMQPHSPPWETSRIIRASLASAVLHQ
jgi:putative hydrolase of the HAD superfamily